MCAALCLLPVWGAAQVLPELPQVYVDTTMPVMNGNTYTVNAGGNLQSVINTAAAADPTKNHVINLQAGATFTGPFTLPARAAGNGWVVIRTSAHASLSPEGTRVTPAQANLMPKIVAPTGATVITAAANAHHYRFIGVEVKQQTGAYVYNLVALGNWESTVVAQPHHIIFDRSYIHGNPSDGTVRGIMMNGVHQAVIDSHISDIKDCGQDTQAIGGFSGAGPFKIVNNYLEASGENIMFGGADPAVSNLVPSDIEVRNNYLFKPLSWKIGHPSFQPTPTWCNGLAWAVKNLFELKNARRVLIDRNIFENNWENAQNGFAILFTVRNQDGGCPWCTVQDVTFTNNIVRHTGSVVNMLGGDWPNPSDNTERIWIRNNLFEDVDPATWGGHGRILQFIDGVTNVTFEHNTVFPSASGQGVIFADGSANPGFIFRNNISAFGQYGVIGTGTGTGTHTLTTYFPGALFQRNVLADDNADWYAAYYPPDNVLLASLDNVGFINWEAGDYHLAASSLYKSEGTDGEDIGADINALNNATNCVISGNCGGGGDGDTIPPSVSFVSPTPGSAVSGIVNVTISATDNVGVTMITYEIDGSLIATIVPPTQNFSWDSTTVQDGSHTLTVKAYDAAGNTAQGSVSFMVKNPNPILTHRMYQ